MRKLCESPSLVELRLIASYLENEGVRVEILNEHQGGNPGVPHWALSVWAELWIKDARQFDRAAQLYARYRDEQRREPGPEWMCRQCDESNPGTFECCWNCGSSADAAN